MTDVHEVGSQPDSRSTFAQLAARVLREMSRRYRIRDRVERALGVVEAFSVAAPEACSSNSMSMSMSGGGVHGLQAVSRDAR